MQSQVPQAPAPGYNTVSVQQPKLRGCVAGVEDRPEMGELSDTEERRLEDLKEYLSDGLKMEGPFALRSPFFSSPSDSSWTTPIRKYWSPLHCGRKPSFAGPRVDRTARTSAGSDKPLQTSSAPPRKPASTNDQLGGFLGCPLDLAKSDRARSFPKTTDKLRDSSAEKVQCIVEASRKVSSAFDAFRVAGVLLQGSLEEDLVLKQEKRKLELEVLRLKRDKLKLTMQKKKSLKDKKGVIK
ncbi:uncharacterized protein [Dermacentor andersoni]|uniref:uncharacterized protein n=1 Tax=Dermacentor andersoni TaxID=34620 RepID=UPI002417FD12|nr:uncharacterized protein LOC129387511 [Dermacentor andersoni]